MNDKKKRMMGGAAPIPDLPSSFNVHYDFSNSSCYSGSGTTINNLVGGSNGSTNNGATFSSSDNNGAFQFDGTNDFLQTSFRFYGGIFGNSNYTLSFWIKTGSSVSGTHPLISANHSQPSGMGGAWVTGGKFYGWRMTSGATVSKALSSASSIAANTIYNLTYKSNGNYMHVFINGVEDSATTEVATSQLWEDETLLSTIGTTVDIYNRTVGWFNGSMYAFISWDSVLSDAQILDIYNNGKGNYS